MAKHVLQRIKKCGDIIKVYNYQYGFFTDYKKDNFVETPNKIIDLGDGELVVLNDITGEFLPYKENFKYIFNEDGSYIEKSIFKGRQLQGTTSEEEYLKRRRKTLLKDKNNIQDLINCNINAYKIKGRIVTPKFLTLTFKDNITDLKYSNNEFKNYIKRLNYYISLKVKNYEGLKYVAVIEFQDRGAVHYHILLFNMPYIPHSVLLEKWDLGSVYIEGFIRNGKKNTLAYSNRNDGFLVNGQQVKNIGAYITKTMNYMIKSLEDDRLSGQKCYLNSKGLFTPKIIDLNNCEIKEEVSAFGYTLTPSELVFVNTYDNEYIGMCLCREYNIKILKDKAYRFKDLKHEHDINISAFINCLYNNSINC